MQKIISGLLLSLAVTATVAAQQTVTIKGNVTGDSKGYNKIYLYGQGITSDSAVITNGVFSFSFPYVKGVVPLLYTEYEGKVYHGVSPFAAMIDGPCNIYLKDVDITKGISSGTLSGNTAAEDYQAFGKGNSVISAEIKKTLGEKYPGRDLKDSLYRTEYQQLSKEKTSVYLTEFVKAHPDSYATGMVLRSQRTAVSAAKLEELFNLLSQKQQASESGQSIAAYLQGLKSSATGSTVKDFTLLTPDEKQFTFSSLKGKYVLIDFWASWCGPCKASFPHMKQVYQKYKSDKFEIYSISIDKDKAAWLKELNNQALPWLQALDTKEISQSGFAVTGVPTTYLISPEGKILLKEVGFNPSGNGAIEHKLNELFSM